VGHNAHLEGCTIHDHSLIGSGSVVLHHVTVGPHSLVGACAMVPNNKVIPPHAKALGVPVTIIENAIGDDDFERAVDGYVANVHRYSAELRRLE
jgi:carbonic anhydrase/acetyltransferase-like protein (isoleucine patch superfamily)